MGTLLLFIAIVTGTATFIESDFGTEAAKAMVYNTWWFELAFLILSLNLIGNLINFRMWKVKKLPVLTFHLALLLIVIGAAVTRHFGYEGVMHIREGDTSGSILSRDSYVQVAIKSSSETLHNEKVVHFSVVSPDEYSHTFSVSSGKVTVKSTEFIPQAVMHVVPSSEGPPALSVAIQGNDGMMEKIIMHGDRIDMDGISLAFDSDHADIFIEERNGEPFFTANDTVKSISMHNGKQALFVPGNECPFLPGLVYIFKGRKIVLRRYFRHASVRPVPSEGESRTLLPDAVRFEIKSDGIKKELFVFGRNELKGRIFRTSVNGIDIGISYGSKEITLPFSLRLNDFILERYPGSNSPSSYASEVTLIDERKGIKEDKRIFMNNIMKYEGYRFFQASYDPDEKGTILSVNRDVWGTAITYLGYLLLTLGMIAALIFPGTRFRYLLGKTKKLSNRKKELLGIILFLSVSSAFAFEINPPHKLSEKDAAEFGSLWVQDHGGRIKPLNTLNSEILRKLVKHNRYKGYSADRMVLSMLLDPEYWKTVPVITVKNRELRKTLQLNNRKASFNQFFDTRGRYKISEIVDDAIRKNPARRNKLEQEAIKIDEQLNVFYMTQSGSMLRIFPDPNNSHASWSTPVINSHAIKNNAGSTMFFKYIEALKSGDPTNANEYLNEISRYQIKYASDILPDETRKKVEIFYNRTSVFLWLFPWFFVIGLILLIFQFITLFKPRYQFLSLMKTGFVLILTGFIIYSAGLGVRAYISGHSPWSNGYESMLYIGWVTILAGLIFSRRSPISLSVGALFGGIVLMVAHLSWMNPEITNLVPVLKSYWLTIHVAVITASYGFLSLGALLGFLNLILISFRTAKNRIRLMLTIEELTAITELSLTVGLYMLTIGSFLGGVWANESWGRYWGWDPKETWSAVTILVYAFILHMRLIPGMKDIVLFNFSAVIGFGSVIMTYLGVNYYLAGLHSYAKGEPMPLPSFIYYTIAIVLIVSVSAFINDHRGNREQTG